MLRDAKEKKKKEDSILEKSVPNIYLVKLYNIFKLQSSYQNINLVIKFNT